MPASRGFIYYVSLTGTTGARKKLPLEISENLRAIKRMTKKPVCVGFGISSPAQVAKISGVADGVIVGSAIIKIIEKNKEKRSEEHTSELQSHSYISYAVLCLKKKNHLSYSHPLFQPPPSILSTLKNSLLPTRPIYTRTFPQFLRYTTRSLPSYLFS